MTTTAHYDEAILSDLFKDANGFRPRELFWSNWNASTVAERNTIWDSLLADVERSIAEDKAQDEAAIMSYEHSLSELMAAGAPDRAAAIEWLVGSLREPDHLWQGAGEVCWALGLPYRMEAEFQPWYDRVMKPRWEEEMKGWG